MDFSSDILIESNKNERALYYLTNDAECLFYMITLRIRIIKGIIYMVLIYSSMLSIIIITIVHLFPFALNNIEDFSNVIQLKLFYNKGLDSIYIKGAIGTPLDIIYYAIDTTISHSFILSSNENYNKSCSSTYRSASHDVFTSVKEIAFEETIQLENTVITNYPLIEIQQFNPFIYVPYLGIGKGKTSLISILYQRGLIKKRILQFNEADLIIGDSNPPKSIVSTSSCSMNTSHPLYACHLNNIAINIGKGTTRAQGVIDLSHGNRSVIFDSTYENIILPLEYLEEIDKYLHLTQIDKCVGSISRKDIKYYDCSEDLIDNSVSINFAFDTFILQLRFQDLFEKENFYSSLSRFKITFADNITDITFGFSLFKKLRIGLSQEENKVSFYSKQDYLLYNINSITNNKSFLMSNAISMSLLTVITNTIGIGYCLYIKLYLITNY